eukprot:CAMPEP_0114521914 /NCGR_PEP_ID=MMETSP0109-20121206/20460_1 /TAXON_ID=29199 /ORGANISM="Chlorarachnion reptans, Strain CCCM449" /LENGTH=129 /DNA_ID=CAMNT_0001703091 /DNA_START=195 /DNA_END=580 /DNA_ORIENTATION=+
MGGGLGKKRDKNSGLAPTGQPNDSNDLRREGKDNQAPQVDPMENLGEDLLEASKTGQTNTATLLIEEKANLEARDNLHGRNPLIWASENGHTDIATLLIEKKANLEAEDNCGRTPLISASNNGHTDTAT